MRLADRLPCDDPMSWRCPGEPFGFAQDRFRETSLILPVSRFRNRSEILLPRLRDQNDITRRLLLLVLIRGFFFEGWNKRPTKFLTMPTGTWQSAISTVLWKSTGAVCR